VLAALVAAPAALGLVWNRLSGFKLFGVEVSLTQVSFGLDANLVDAVMVEHYSGKKQLLKLISETLVGREEPVEIPLRRPEKPFWWSTRLFLLAALAVGYTRVHAFVFVDGDEERRFIGLARPDDMRLSFSRKFPSLEEVYERARVKCDRAAPPATQVECMIEEWSISTEFSQEGRKLTEKDIKVEVNRATLLELMGKTNGLDDRCVRWKGFQDRALLAGIIGFDRPYVPLVEYGRLHKVISRHAVVEEIAAKALK
jgi:hypothetical protein